MFENLRFRWFLRSLLVFTYASVCTCSVTYRIPACYPLSPLSGPQRKMLPCLFYSCRTKPRAWQIIGFNLYQPVSSCMTHTIVCLRERARVEGREKVRQGERETLSVCSKQDGCDIFLFRFASHTGPACTRPPYLSKLFVFLNIDIDR